MELVRNTKDFKYDNTAVTLGKFDGMHLGHMSLLKDVTRFAGEGLVPVLFTFDLSPYELLGKKSAGYLLTHEEKYEICERAGIKVLVEYPFDCDTMHMEAESFVKEVLVNRLGVSKIVVGEDFCFGKERTGNIETLKRMFPEEMLDIKSKVMYGDREISSTYIKECIVSGNIHKANEMLGRRYSLRGYIAEGKKIGRKIGFPTINMVVSAEKLLPKAGVYCSHVKIEKKTYNGITNIGSNPTVSDDTGIKAETHLLGCSGNLYGKEACVELDGYIREEKKFDNLDELKEQIKKDVSYMQSMIH